MNADLYRSKQFIPQARCFGFKSLRDPNRKLSFQQDNMKSTKIISMKFSKSQIKDIQEKFNPPSLKRANTQKFIIKSYKHLNTSRIQSPLYSRENVSQELKSIPNQRKKSLINGYNKRIQRKNLLLQKKFQQNNLYRSRSSISFRKSFKVSALKMKYENVYNIPGKKQYSQRAYKSIKYIEDYQMNQIDNKAMGKKKYFFQELQMAHDYTCKEIKKTQQRFIQNNHGLHDNQKVHFNPEQSLLKGLQAYVNKNTWRTRQLQQIEEQKFLNMQKFQRNMVKELKNYRYNRQRGIKSKYLS